MAARTVSVVGREGAAHPRVVEIQRSRMLAAAARAVEELGYTRATVAHITRRAKVSRRTFYELFSNREECLIAALEGVVDSIRGELLAAELGALPWRERMREGVLTMFNPTDCEALAVNGTLSSTQGASASLSSHFQAANCANLPFKPVFTVSTQAKTSKQNGASLTVKGRFPSGEANIHSVWVVLPKQLPARLTTIQQACPEATFAANPATCPTGSMIGVATASTPILASPVVGPAYLVSHGGAAFPDVVAILQGEGITVQLVGSIDIKHGITSSDFATIPDAPISSFQLTLPEGPHSGLAAVLPAKAKGNMCGTALQMPFTITGQNGAQLKQNVKIQVTGCPKPKAKKKKTKAKGKKGKK